MIEHRGKLRRFWDHVSLKDEKAGYTILLDEHPVRLPKKSILQVPSQILAEHLLQEWQTAGGKKGEWFPFTELPLTQMVATMLERISPQREVCIQALLPYVNGELLCYRAETPNKLVQKQKELWDPWIKWCEDFLKVDLIIGQGIMPLHQSEEVIQNFYRYLTQMTDGELTTMAVTIPASGSIILAAALKEHQLNAQQVFELTTLDDQIQAEIWGKDEEQQKSLHQLQQDIAEAALFLSLVECK